MLNPQGLGSLVIRFQKFLLIGAVGFAINMGLLYLLTTNLATYYILSSFIAIEVSLFVTFILNENWTWRDRRQGHIASRFWKYQVINGIGLGINILVLFLLTHFLSLYYLLSNIGGAGLAAFWNFGANHLLTWRIKHEPEVQ